MYATLERGLSLVVFDMPGLAGCDRHTEASPQRQGRPELLAAAFVTPRGLSPFVEPRGSPRTTSRRAPGRAS